MTIIPESALYPAVRQFLDVRFSKLRAPATAVSLWRSEQTPRLGIQLQGKWTRPDLAAVHVWRYKFGPTFNVDLHSFEVKRADNCNEISIFEALAHTRIVHYAHVVWHRPDPNVQLDRLRSIEDNCRAFGVGLITFNDHLEPDSFRVHDVTARRATPDLTLADQFIEAAFPSHVDTISSWLPRLP